MSKYILIIFCLMLFSYSAYNQTASATAGCAELKVEFTAPNASSYFWVFGDGPSSVSTLQNPEHSYIQPGTYTAQLFNQEGGTQVGSDIIITVYPPIEIDINADVREGCAPLEVNFTSTIDIHPDIEVENIVWTFGDGNSASGANTTYTYRENGTFTVSIKVITKGDIKCDEPVIFEDYIVTEGDRVRFIVDKSTSCDVPSDFTFTNTTGELDGSMYIWDFGNGQTSTDVGPHTINYDTEGVYSPELTIISPSGCESTFMRTISVGAPTITPTFPDTVCLNVQTTLNQSTIARFFEWDFTGTSIDTTFSPRITDQKRPIVVFTEPGLQTFTLKAIAQDSCETTNTLSIFVYQPDAGYTLGPESVCDDPLFITYTANDPGLLTYTFNNDIKGGGTNIESDSPNGSSLYVVPERDEYYINEQDSLTTMLIVTSAQGCADTAFQKYYLQKPEAFFVADVVKGCIPFEVNFSDLSYSDFEIDIREWDYGDGQDDTFSTEDTLISHVYNTAGFHEAVLTITDEKGCKDISREIQIIAIDKDTIQVPAIPAECDELTFCVDEDVSFQVLSDQVFLNIHIETDEGRFNHCWRDQIATHAFQYPGVYPLDGTVEFLTIFIDSVSTGCDITIEGSRSDIDYFIDCANPNEVSFSAENSINADQYNWFLEDQLISDEESFVHTFSEPGEYVVYLDTNQDRINCTHRDSAIIHITDVEAIMSIPEKSCASSPSVLDASASIDAHTTCYAGYTWIFEDQRPRETGSAFLNHTFLPGPQTVTLVVEDINGCKDTATANTIAYDLDADFEVGTLICLPSEQELTDLSVGDTSVVGWVWDFGASGSGLESPVHTFDTLDFDPNLLGDSIMVTLRVADAVGCLDYDTILIGTYEIFSEMTVSQSAFICQNDMVTFNAADYNLSGSFLTYDWDFGSAGSSTESNPTITFDEPGIFPVLLTFTEDASGCQGTLDTVIDVTAIPMANFISDQDDDEFICFPEQIAFTNTSTSITDQETVYFWDFGNGAQSDIENPVIPFDKGTYEVTLVVSTIEGCKDTVTQSYTLVGPEGTFTVDKEEVCPGEEITFTLLDVIDVSTYTWDFGDGVQINNQSPVTHTYDPQSSVTVFEPTLILRSDENGCELIQDLPISVSSITANFSDTTGVCPGELTFQSDFDNPQTIEWNVDGQIITGNSAPSVTVDSEADSINVLLTVTDANGCVVERIRRVANPDLDAALIKYPNVFSPNGDNTNPVFNIVYDDTMLTGEVEVTDFRVYNRWGELLYNNQNPSVGWDGTYKNIMVPPDVYGYFIEVSIPGCITRSKKGNVTVIK